MKKTFDCLVLKDNIQKQMLKQMEGFSADKRRETLRAALEASRSPIGNLWRTLGNRPIVDALCVAEKSTRYGN